jgi:hypothetical protein
MMTTAGITLEPPNRQPITARLAGAGSLSSDLAAVLDVASVDADAGEFRRLILDENAASKRSSTARMWAWKRLKLRYALDSTDAREYRAFRAAYRNATTAADRGLIVGLMLSRTDRLFREATLSLISPYLPAGGRSLDAADVAAFVDDQRRANALMWSKESLRSVTNHLISSWRDVGFIRPGRGIVISQASPGPAVTTFAAALAKAEGLTDRAVLKSTWFQVLGADEQHATELLRDAAAAGALTFKFQADVVEIRFHDDPDGVA